MLTIEKNRTDKSVDILTTTGIVGSWKLQKCIVNKLDGSPLPYWRENTEGIITYQDNGRMSVFVSSKDRPCFLVNDFLGGTDTEIKKAFEGFIAYYGSYVYEKNKGLVHHNIEQSLLPNWSGTVQTRFTQLFSNHLILSTPTVEINSTPCTMELSWERF